MKALPSSHGSGFSRCPSERGLLSTGGGRGAQVSQGQADGWPRLSQAWTPPEAWEPTPRICQHLLWMGQRGLWHVRWVERGIQTGLWVFPFSLLLLSLPPIFEVAAFTLG